MSFREFVSMFPNKGATLVFADGATNDTTSVTLVGAPGANRKRALVWVNVINVDTATKDVRIEHTTSGPSTVDIAGQNMTAGSNWEWPKYGFYEIEGADDTININLTAAATTNQLRWTCAYVEIED